jgi:nucleotide-binding universal stress UspA family protein
MMKFKKVLIPIDFSEFSKQAISTCSTLFASDESIEFHFIYVWRLPSDYVTWTTDPKPEMQEKLETFVAEFEHAGEHTRHINLLTGHPAMAICDYASEHECDLIALATHGRTGIAHLLIGSTAEQVVRHASCPVLSLRLPVGSPCT